MIKADPSETGSTNGETRDFSYYRSYRFMWTWIRIFTDVLFPISLDRGQDEAAVLMNKPAMAGGVGSHWLGIAKIFTTCPETNVSVGERETGCNCFSRLNVSPASTG